MTDKKPHHHGNLREALVDAGVSLLETDGLNALSLRKCAAIAGVSHAAPAHHFGGLNGLIAAIATRGFLSFADYMTKEKDRCRSNPATQLRGILIGYLNFAADHPALFTLMFGTRIEIEVDNTLASAANMSYAMLADACAPFIEPNDPSPRATEVLVWSLVHGYATLRHFGQGTPNGPIENILLDDLTLRLPLLANALSQGTAND